jgi:hypothetical protein
MCRLQYSSITRPCHPPRLGGKVKRIGSIGQDSRHEDLLVSGDRAPLDRNEWPSAGSHTQSGRYREQKNLLVQTRIELLIPVLKPVVYSLCRRSSITVTLCSICSLHKYIYFSSCYFMEPNIIPWVRAQLLQPHKAGTLMAPYMQSLSLSRAESQLTTSTLQT